jgi:hypothetical protein
MSFIAYCISNFFPISLSLSLPLNGRPRRTRTSSGSIVRIFRGEFTGTLGGSLSAQGLDRRVLVKEFTDSDLALELVRSELQSLARLQSNLLFSTITSSSNVAAEEKAKQHGTEWIRAASARRSVDLRKDTANVVTLMKALAIAPYVGILGTSIDFFFDMNIKYSRHSNYFLFLNKYCQRNHNKR